MSFTLVIELADKLVDRPRCIRLWLVLQTAERATPAETGYLPFMVFTRFTAVDAGRHGELQIPQSSAQE